MTCPLSRRARHSYKSIRIGKKLRLVSEDEHGAGYGDKDKEGVENLRKAGR